jgi:hypothetical protein
MRHAEKSAGLTPGNPTTKTLIESIRARRAALETK